MRIMETLMSAGWDELDPDSSATRADVRAVVRGAQREFGNMAGSARYWARQWTEGADPLADIGSDAWQDYQAMLYADAVADVFGFLAGDVPATAKLAAIVNHERVE